MDKINSFFPPTYTSQIGETKAHVNYCDNEINMKDLYSQEELDSIISGFDCLMGTLPGSSQKCEYEMTYLPESDYVIINNKHMTNDTVEINRKGQARSVGSWHNEKLDGDYSDIIKDVKARNEAAKANKEAKLSSQLDAMSELGKSQVNKQ